MFGKNATRQRDVLAKRYEAVLQNYPVHRITGSKEEQKIIDKNRNLEYWKGTEDDLVSELNDWINEYCYQTQEVNFENCSYAEMWVNRIFRLIRKKGVDTLKLREHSRWEIAKEPILMDLAIRHLFMPDSSIA